jgi:hypothetical protein
LPGLRRIYAARLSIPATHDTAPPTSPGPHQRPIQMPGAAQVHMLLAAAGQVPCNVRLSMHMSAIGIQLGCFDPACSISVRLWWHTGRPDCSSCHLPPTPAAPLLYGLRAVCHYVLCTHQLRRDGIRVAVTVKEGTLWSLLCTYVARLSIPATQDTAPPTSPGPHQRPIQMPGAAHVHMRLEACCAGAPQCVTSAACTCQQLEFQLACAHPEWDGDIVWIFR